MPKKLYEHLLQYGLAGLLAFSAHLQWSTALTMERHGEKIQVLERRVDKLEL